MVMGQAADPDIWDAVFKIWSMYHTNPWFIAAVTIIALPFILGWYNYFKKQSAESGINDFVSRMNANLTQALSLPNKGKVIADLINVTPGARRVSRINPWDWYLIVMYGLLSLIVGWNATFAQEVTIISLAYWKATWLLNVCLLLFIGGATGLFLWDGKKLERRTVRVIEHMMSATAFVAIAAEFAKGLDSRYVRPALYYESINARDHDLMRITDIDGLIRDCLAHNVIKQRSDGRYYLTRFGATVVHFVRTHSSREGNQ